MEAAWIALDSSSLIAVAYDDHLALLTVHFRDGSVYTYRNVPQHLFHNLLAASSKGAFFNRHIQSCFSYARVG